MKHWSNYWTTSNTLNSFAESDASKGYTGPIRDYWFNVFSDLKAGSRIVDIGCGNGALACLAIEYSEKHNMDFDVHGIDAADINPPVALKDSPNSLKLLQQINFHSKTPAEMLPFKSNSIDLFISQFGFEYADIGQAIQQCDQALADHGSINILAHHPESFISHDTLAGSHLFKAVLHSSPLFVQVDLLLDIASQVHASGQFHTWNQNPYNQSISQTIKWIIDVLKSEFNEEKYSVWLHDILNRVIPILQSTPKADPNGLRSHLSHQYRTLDEHNARLEEQIKATLTDEMISTLEKEVSLLKRDINYSSFRIDNTPFAWSIKIK